MWPPLIKVKQEAVLGACGSASIAAYLTVWIQFTRVGRLLCVLACILTIIHLIMCNYGEGIARAQRKAVWGRQGLAGGFSCSSTLCSETVYVANLGPKWRDAITVTDKFSITAIKKSNLNVTSSARLVALVN